MKRLREVVPLREENELFLNKIHHHASAEKIKNIATASPAGARIVIKPKKNSISVADASKFLHDEMFDYEERPVTRGYVYHLGEGKHVYKLGNSDDIYPFDDDYEKLQHHPILNKLHKHGILPSDPEDRPKIEEIKNKMLW